MLLPAAGDAWSLREDSTPCAAHLPPTNTDWGRCPASPSSCSTNVPHLALSAGRRHAGLAAWNSPSGTRWPFLETYRFARQDKPGPWFLLKAPSPHRTPQVPVSLLLSSLSWRGDRLRGTGSGRRPSSSVPERVASFRPRSPSPQAVDRAHPAHSEGPALQGWDGPAQPQQLGLWDSWAFLGWEAGPTPAVARPRSLPAALGVGSSSVWFFHAFAQTQGPATHKGPAA